ncbi:MAG: tyrosine-type recombinase/integrase [Bacteroidales bacterium]|nr:tyrosine-type recombinase/integrase [Bacteroidales bacterium]
MVEVKEFLDKMSYENRYSSNTILAYNNDLSSFLSFLNTHHPELDLQHIKLNIVRQWIANLSESGLESSSINRKITSLRTFFAYLKKESKIEFNIVADVKSLKQPKNLPHYLTEQSMNSLFDEIVFDTDYKGVLSKTVLLLFYYTGIRLSELLSLKNSDVDYFNEQIKVVGKRNKQRIIPIGKELILQLKAYQYEKQKLGFPMLSNAKMFLTPKGNAMYPKFVYRMVNDKLNNVTTQKKKSPHVLRHSFATHMLNNGADLNTIKEILGHESLSATQIYTHNNIDQLKSVYKQAHPKA